MYGVTLTIVMAGWRWRGREGGGGGEERRDSVKESSGEKGCVHDNFAS